MLRPVQPFDLALGLVPPRICSHQPAKEPVMAKKDATQELKKEIKTRKAKIEKQLGKMKKAVKALKKAG